MSGIMSMLLGARTAIAAAVDEFFNRVTLLLPGNGTNGAQNNTFLDSSTNNFTITRNGNTTQGTFSPFSQTGWSNYFNGSTDFLAVPDNNSYAFTGDFCIEAFVYLNSLPTESAVFSQWFGGTVSNTAIYFYINSSGRIVFVTGVGSTQTTITATSTTVSANQWVHVAVCRSGTTVRLFVNGVADTTTGTVSGTINNIAYTPQIGNLNNGGVSANFLNGYISNLRVTNGALYTSNFTPSTTPLTTTVSAGSVILLTCQSNRFVDNSSNAFAITINGSPSVQAFSPFLPTTAYSAATVGGSGYFDGTGDYLTTSSTNSAWSLGTGDFQISFWLYPQAVNGFRDIFTQQNIGGTPQIFLVGNLLRYNNAGIAAILDATATIKVNEWVYCVLSRVSGTTRWFINGAAAGSVSDTNNWSNTNGWYVSTNAQPYQGYITDLRLVKGSGVTSSTVPTAPDAAITNTQFLVGFTNAGLTDATAKNVLETVGNAQISTAQSKFGGSSIAFDGTTDALGLPNTPVLQLGSADYTMEFWAYRAASTNMTWIFLDGNSSNYAGLRLDTDSSGNIFLLVSTSGSAWAINTSGTAVLSTNTWTHIAVVRSGTSMKLYVNGTSQISTTLSGSVMSGTSHSIGSNFGATQVVNGYVDDLRLTLGHARYTANFSVPTAAFALQ